MGSGCSVREAASRVFPVPSPVPAYRYRARTADVLRHAECAHFATATGTRIPVHPLVGQRGRRGALNGGLPCGVQHVRTSVRDSPRRRLKLEYRPGAVPCEPLPERRHRHVDSMPFGSRRAAETYVRSGATRRRCRAMSRPVGRGLSPREASRPQPHLAVPASLTMPPAQGRGRPSRSVGFVVPVSHCHGMHSTRRGGAAGGHTNCRGYEESRLRASYR